MFQWVNDTDDNDFSQQEIENAMRFYYIQFMHPQLLRLEAMGMSDLRINNILAMASNNQHKGQLPHEALCLEVNTILRVN